MNDTEREPLFKCALVASLANPNSSRGQMLFLVLWCETTEAQAWVYLLDLISQGRGLDGIFEWGFASIPRWVSTLGWMEGLLLVGTIQRTGLKGANSGPRN